MALFSKTVLVLQKNWAPHVLHLMHIYTANWLVYIYWRVNFVDSM